MWSTCEKGVLAEEMLPFGFVIRNLLFSAFTLHQKILYPLFGIAWRTRFETRKGEFYLEEISHSGLECGMAHLDSRATHILGMAVREEISIALRHYNALVARPLSLSSALLRSS